MRTFCTFTNRDTIYDRRISRRGMALIDVIIGGIMLSIGLAVVISMAGRSMGMQTNGEKRMVAAWLADQKLNMVLVEGPEAYPDLYDTHGQFDEPFSEFEYALEFKDRGLRLPYRVTATIRWPSGRDMDEITVETMIARRLGEPFQPREPLELLDREARWYEIKYGDPSEPSVSGDSSGSSGSSGTTGSSGSSGTFGSTPGGR